jgi:hypothetical protein
VQVFVASSSLDSTTLAELRRVLLDAEPGVWHVVEIDRPDPDWKRRARDFIEQADALLFVTSKHSVASPHCAWELATALSMGKPCFQWVIESVDLSHDATRLPVVKRGDARDAHLWNFVDEA